MALFGARGAMAAKEARRRVEGWARTSLGIDAATVLRASEIVCPDPACPGTETVILIMQPSRRTRAVKIAKPLEAVEEADVLGALRALDAT